MYKKRYHSSLKNYKWEKYFKQPILRIGFRKANLVKKSKHKFGLIVKLITNKYYMDLFC